MRKMIILFCFLFGLFLVVFGGCESETKKLEKERANQYAQDFVAAPHKERTALLSVKYNIEESKLESLLHEYLSEHDLFYRAFETAETKKKVDLRINLNFRDTLTVLSNKYNIPKDVLANLIIDYRILKKN